MQICSLRRASSKRRSKQGQTDNDGKCLGAKARSLLSHWQFTQEPIFGSGDTWLDLFKKPSIGPRFKSGRASLLCVSSDTLRLLPSVKCFCALVLSASVPPVSLFVQGTNQGPVGFGGWTARMGSCKKYMYSTQPGGKGLSHALCLLEGYRLELKHSLLASGILACQSYG